MNGLHFNYCGLPESYKSRCDGTPSLMIDDKHNCDTYTNEDIDNRKTKFMKSEDPTKTYLSITYHNDKICKDKIKYKWETRVMCNKKYTEFEDV